MNRVPGRAAGTASAHTDRTCLPAGSMVIATSASPTASPTLPAIAAPLSPAAWHEAALRS